MLVDCFLNSAHAVVRGRKQRGIKTKSLEAAIAHEGRNWKIYRGRKQPGSILTKARQSNLREKRSRRVSKNPEPGLKIDPVF